MENALSDTLPTPENPEKTALLNILKLSRNRLKKINNKIQKQQTEFSEAQNWIINQQVGDSLLADPSVITKGSAQVDIINIHSQQIQTIKINPKLNAVKNAQLYYKRAKKGKRGLDQCGKQLQSSKDEYALITSLMEETQDCLNSAEEKSQLFQKKFDTVLAAASSLDIPVPAGESDKRHVKQDEPTPFRHFTIDNWNVYVGRNDEQNDELTTRFTKPWDLWFHVAVHSGSHVVLQLEKNGPEPPLEVIKKIAALTVWFSKARHTSYAEVHMTHGRFVRKPRKAPSGQVILDRFKILRVSPMSPQEMFKNSSVSND